MKILRLDRYGSRPALMADSCLRPDRRPLFLPEDFEVECSLRPALRIDRLGKCIAPQFAMRYIGAWSIVNYTRPMGENAEADPDMADDALVQGTWLPLPDGLVTADTPQGALTFVPQPEQWSEVLAALSRHSTFKTGDMLVLPAPLPPYRPRIDTHFVVSLGGEPILQFNIK